MLRNSTEPASPLSATTLADLLRVRPDLDGDRAIAFTGPDFGQPYPRPRELSVAIDELRQLLDLG